MNIPFAIALALSVDLRFLDGSPIGSNAFALGIAFLRTRQLALGSSRLSLWLKEPAQVYQRFPDFGCIEFGW